MERGRAGSASLRSTTSPPSFSSPSFSFSFFSFPSSSSFSSSPSSSSPSRGPAAPGPWKRSRRMAAGSAGDSRAGAIQDVRGDDATTVRRRRERPPRGVPAPLGGPTNGSAEQEGRPRTRSRHDGAGAMVELRGSVRGKRCSAAPRPRRRLPRASGVPGGQGKAAQGHRRRPRPSPIRIQSVLRRGN
ncbi:dapper homolog 3-like [Gallus gallus]|uniref:dapper homolog 3-like n=1 Tax=Gallus gallus TaxID=9031 RepID=UPI001F00D714|nr:dapper homolog 3-like isoform X1 [Gallus gallus]XP_040562553.2 dapper homolog 3-like [Gallus gallus]XP_046755057.1 dapper homolog 3-like [Gallus gallus]